MSDNNFEVKGIDKFIEKLNDTQTDFPKELQKLIEKHGGKLQASTKRRTPVGKYNDGRTGGTLRRNWKLEKGDFYIRLYNNTHYGIHVEYGHRTRGGKKYIDGVYMLKKSFEKQVKEFEQDLDSLLAKYGFK